MIETLDQIEDKEPEKFVLYKSFPTLNEANELIHLLEEHDIPFSIVENAYDLDLTFGGNLNQSDIQILIKSSSFKEVDRLMEKVIEEQIKAADPGHYLFQFSDEELLEVVEKSDEWSPYDYALAKDILQKKGVLNPEKIEALKEARAEEQSEPQEASSLQIGLGYISALIGGILGLLIGWYLWQSKTTDADGEMRYTYSDTNRNHGQLIFFLGIFVSIGFVVYYFFLK